MIKVLYQASDGYRLTKKYKTLRGAQRFAQKWVGSTPELGTGYAASFDGIGTIRVQGASLSDLFPEVREPSPVRASCCSDPMVRGGRCESCGQWLSDLAQA